MKPLYDVQPGVVLDTVSDVQILARAVLMLMDRADNPQEQAAIADPMNEVTTLAPTLSSDDEVAVVLAGDVTEGQTAIALQVLQTAMKRSVEPEEGEAYARMLKQFQVVTLQSTKYAVQNKS